VDHYCPFDNLLSEQHVAHLRSLGANMPSFGNETLTGFLCTFHFDIELYTFSRQNIRMVYTI
jgi:hypothetical protein